MQIRIPKRIKTYTYRPRSVGGWREIGGVKKYFRSKYEANFARYLEWLKEMNHIQGWEFEPKTFWFLEIKRGVRSYLPDFKVTLNDGSHTWVEIKGYMDPKSVTKLKRFRKYYAEEVINVHDKEWFTKNGPRLKGVIKDWE